MVLLNRHKLHKKRFFTNLSTPLALLFFLAIFFPKVGYTQQSASESQARKKAEALYQSARELMKEERLQEAVEAYQESYQLFLQQAPTHRRLSDITLRLGLCYIKMEQSKESAEAYCEYHRSAHPSEHSQNVDGAIKLLDTALKKQETLSISELEEQTPLQQTTTAQIDRLCKQYSFSLQIKPPKDPSLEMTLIPSVLATKNEAEKTSENTVLPPAETEKNITDIPQFEIRRFILPATLALAGGVLATSSVILKNKFDNNASLGKNEFPILFATSLGADLAFVAAGGTLLLEFID